jgi:hypothetical protein
VQTVRARSELLLFYLVESTQRPLTVTVEVASSSFASFTSISIVGTLRPAASLRRVEREMPERAARAFRVSPRRSRKVNRSSAIARGERILMNVKTVVVIPHNPGCRRITVSR